MSVRIKEEMCCDIAGKESAASIIEEITAENFPAPKSPLSASFKEENFNNVAEYDNSAGTCDDSNKLDEADDSSANSMEYDSMFTKVEMNGVSYLECILCFKKLKHSSIRQHFKTHAGLRPHACDVCGSRFTRRNDVVRHKRIVHKKIRPFTCRKCNKIFPFRGALIAHLQNHDKSVSYDCLTCGFKFGKKEYYDNHVKYLHPSDEVGANDIEVELQDSSNNSKVPSNFGTDSSTFNHSTSLLKSNSSKSSDITSFLSFKTTSYNDASTEDITDKILDSAVEKSKIALDNLATTSSHTFATRNRKSNSIRICIKAPINGRVQEFLIDVFAEKQFDVESPSGMQTLFNMISEVCASEGQIDGRIEIEFLNC